MDLVESGDVEAIRSETPRSAGGGSDTCVCVCCLLAPPPRPSFPLPIFSIGSWLFEFEEASKRRCLQYPLWGSHENLAPRPAAPCRRREPTVRARRKHHGVALRAPPVPGRRPWRHVRPREPQGVTPGDWGGKGGAALPGHPSGCKVAEKLSQESGPSWNILGAILEPYLGPLGAILGALVDSLEPQEGARTGCEGSGPPLQ